MIYNVKINQICITLVYSRDTISKKMRNLNVKLIIEARFEFCYIIGRSRILCLFRSCGADVITCQLIV